MTADRSIQHDKLCPVQRIKIQFDNFLKTQKWSVYHLSNATLKVQAAICNSRICRAHSKAKNIPKNFANFISFEYSSSSSSYASGDLKTNFTSIFVCRCELILPSLLLLYYIWWKLLKTLLDFSRSRIHSRREFLQPSSTSESALCSCSEPRPIFGCDLWGGASCWHSSSSPE